MEGSGQNCLFLNRLKGINSIGVPDFLVNPEQKNETGPCSPARLLLLAMCLTGAAGVPLAAGGAPSIPASAAREAPVAARRPRPLALPPDRRTALPTRRSAAARLRELAAQREFRYVEPATSPAANTFWARLWGWLSQLLSSRAGQYAWRYGLSTAMVAALAFAVLKLLQVDITGVFGRSARRGALAYGTASENIHAVDFPARIAEAEADGNLRLATRLGYLEVLKHLTDRGLIHWQPNKTNQAYLAELAAGPLREAFQGATREFEYVWYGELRLSAARYQQARTDQRAVAVPPAGENTIVPPPPFPAARPA